ncbi:MAG: hypothetical protein F2704_01420 [Actinobacteria bacterium]|uniref:Unannotated protein n=1 Tax=freshwater metagenome TaxID=449393 RepID=A0A6J6T8Q7_9ZZZZ|nr:hypothetical protein [Actinomycetota bacterium]MSW47039.1 hypothetical protein [Actinomycetota bacterium]MSX25078.1 hypothetical protein [Actinomycetota bacterium]MSY46334.1 hypothetical protein [Actinomycetota bacterium]MSY56911.1 hypothetical protein [Actinomycetota bacterium]
MAIAVAVDGGGSTLRVAILGADVSIKEFPGFTPGQGSFTEYLINYLGEALQGHTAISRMVVASAAQPANQAERIQMQSALHSAFGMQELWLTSDAVSAHQATIKGDGVVIAAGTGVAALAVGNKRSTVHALSGDGYLIGDEGGAFWIGQRGLNSALRSKDGRGGSELLLKRACEFFNTSPEYLADLVHQLPRPVYSIATFASIVAQAAESNDADAIAILTQGANEILLIATTAQKLCNGVDGFEIALSGGAIPPGRIFHQLVQAALQNKGMYLAQSCSSPLQGAIELAQLENPGVFASEIHQVTFKAS